MEAGIKRVRGKEAEAAFAKQEAALQRVTEEGSDAENAGGSVKTEQTAQAEKTSQKDIAEKEKTLTSRQNLFIIILYGRLQVKAMTERVGFI